MAANMAAAWFSVWVQLNVLYQRAERARETHTQTERETERAREIGWYCKAGGSGWQADLSAYQ